MQPEFDLIIVGSGPTGCALALALARHAPRPERILLLGPESAAQGAPQDGGAADPRALALNHGSRQFLQSLGCWPARAAPITRVQVSQAGHLGRTLIDCQELGVAQLGCVVAYDDLRAAMHQALAQSPISWRRERAPQDLYRLRASHGGARASAAPLLVVSDGAAPHGWQRDYRQHALLANLRASAPQPGLAFERFTRSGPLALLPHPASADCYSLVWCQPPQRAAALAALPAHEFVAELRLAFGAHLGELELVSAVSSFALRLQAGSAILGPAMVALGNAAQTLHPVAGQGLNLGLRDVGQLSQILTPWLLRPERDVQALLERYSRARRPDRAITMGITDNLARVFASERGWQRHACGLGLVLMDMFAPLRLPLARQLLRGTRL